VQTGTVGDYFLMGVNSTGPLDPMQNLEHIKVNMTDGSYSWEFWRDRNTADYRDTVVDCEEEISISFAVGITSSDVVGYHGINRGNLRLSFEIVQTIFVWWSDDINLPLAMTVLKISIPAISVLYALAWFTNRLDRTELIIGAFVCVYDCVSDYLVIVKWWSTEDYGWAIFMLLAIFGGGVVTAVLLRVEEFRDLKRACKCHCCVVPTSRQILELTVDILGFAVIRLINSEWNDRKDQRKSMNEQLQESKAVRASSNIDEFEQTVEQESSRQRRLRMVKLLTGKVAGNLVESFLSFSLVSYYLIMGTMPFHPHPDITEPPSELYLAWTASLLGILYKAYRLAISTRDGDFDISSFLLIIFVGLSFILPFMLVALLPPVLLAQDRNGIHTILCPVSISSNIGATYALFWCLPFPVIIACGYFVRQMVLKDDTHFALFCTPPSMYVLWMSLTYISYNPFREDSEIEKGTFRTSFAKSVYMLGFVSALFVLLLSLATIVIFIGWIFYVSYAKISNICASTTKGLMELFANHSSNYEDNNKSRSAIDDTESELGVNSSSDFFKVIKTEVMEDDEEEKLQQQKKSFVLQLT